MNAIGLFSLELHRTPTDFEDNFISKMYLFQFVNFYTSLFYIAFVKGRYVYTYIQLYGFKDQYLLPCHHSVSMTTSTAVKTSDSQPLLLFISIIADSRGSLAVTTVI